MRIRSSQRFDPNSRTSFAVDCTDARSITTRPVAWRHTGAPPKALLRDRGAIVENARCSISGVFVPSSGDHRRADLPLCQARGASSPTERTDHPASLTVGGLDIRKEVTDSITYLRTTLAGITDAASAQAALPKLQDVTAQIDKVDSLVGQLSPEQRKVLAGMVNPLMPSLDQLFDKVLAIPGVAELLKPTIDALRAKLAMLTA